MSNTPPSLTVTCLPLKNTHSSSVALGNIGLLKLRDVPGQHYPPNTTTSWPLLFNAVNKQMITYLASIVCVFSSLISSTSHSSLCSLFLPAKLVSLKFLQQASCPGPSEPICLWFSLPRQLLTQQAVLGFCSQFISERCVLTILYKRVTCSIHSLHFLLYYIFLYGLYCLAYFIFILLSLCIPIIHYNCISWV